MIIHLRLKDGRGHTPYKIAKEFHKPINTVLNEICRGTTTQNKQGKKTEVYLAEAGEIIYHKNRQNSCYSYKRLEYSKVID